MTGMPPIQRTPTAVPATSATSGGGTSFLSRGGQATATARVITATATAPGSRLASASGSARNAPIAPPATGGRPRKGMLWIRMMDDADPGHEAGHDHRRRVRDEAADPERAHGDLQQPPP